MEIVYRAGAPEQLWDCAVQPVYLIHGEENLLKQEAIEGIRAHLTPGDVADFDLEYLHAGEVGSDRILASVNQAPFSAEKRLVIVRGVQHWREKGGQPEADRFALAIRANPPAGCVVLVVEPDGEESRRKTIISTKLDAAVREVGALVECKPLKGESLVDWVVSIVALDDKHIDHDAAIALIGIVGPEMMSLRQEIQKLISYVGASRLITATDAAAVAANGLEDVIFATIDAITNRRLDRALVLLSELHRYDPKPQTVAAKVLALLGRQFRMIWQAKLLVERGVHPRDLRSIPAAVAQDLPLESSITQLGYRANEAFRLAQGYSWRELARILDQLLDCDMANKGGVLEESSVFGAEVTTNLQILVINLARAA